MALRWNITIRPLAIACVIVSNTVYYTQSKETVCP